MSPATLAFLVILLVASAASRSEIADSLERKQAEARTTLLLALSALHNIPDVGEKNSVMQTIGVALVAADDEADARQIDKKLESGETLHPILKAIALSQLNKGNIDDALFTARDMKDQDASDLTYMALAEQADKNGDPELAVRLCQLSTGSFRLESLLLAARIQAQTGKEEASTATLNAAKVLAVRQTEVAKIAVTEALLGNLDHANRLLGRLRREHDRSHVYAAMVWVEAQAKDFDNANAHMDEINDDELRSISLGRIAMARAELGQIKQAVDGIEMISDDEIRLDHQRALTKLVLEKQGLPAAHTIAAGFLTDAGKAVCLSQLAVAAARGGNAKLAQTSLTEAKVFLARPQTTTEAALAAVVENLSWMDKSAEAIDLAARITDSSRRSSAIRQIVRITARMHDPATARKLADSIVDPHDRALALVGLAEGTMYATDAED